MAPMGPDKRKARGDMSSSAGRKRVKMQDARTIAVQSSDTALSKTGELDVAAFVAARQFEIRALEAGIRDSKNSAASRAFQKVSRNLRRRTASHNVKRVPRRLRARAKREMIEDNTPTVTARRRKPTELLRLRLETARRLQGLDARSKKNKRAAAKTASKDLPPGSEHDVNIAPRVPKIKKNKLSHPEKPQSKFKKRQRGKTWLPTHLFHAKRATMTEPKEPLWRFAIPLTPTEKSYRPTHRAGGSRGAIAWDASYISTIGLEGTESSIESLLQAMGVSGLNTQGSKGLRWRNGTRSLKSWVFERDGKKLPIAPVSLIWCAVNKPEDIEMTDAGSEAKPDGNKTKQPKRRMFLRVHPSAFLQLWEELLKISKIQKSHVMVEDLRFEIGSIDISGPGATEALLAALQPVPTDDQAKQPENTWKSLVGLTNAASLPQNALLSFNVSDPRLRFPPKTIKHSNSEESHNTLIEMLSSWPPDSTASPSDLFSRPARLTASRLLPSQKAINRRKSLADPGEYPSSKPTDPKIPVILLASRPGGISSNSNSQGTWTVLLPWKCVTPFWYYIMYYPLSSGGNPRFGGVREQQQLAFESNEPWFPGDYPGTKAGWIWGVNQSEKEKEKWGRKPKGKRVEFDSVDLGNGNKGEIGRGWACDWERLVSGPGPPGKDAVAEPNVRPANAPQPKAKSDGDSKQKDSKLADPSISPSPPLDIHQLEPSLASSILSRKAKPGPLPLSIKSILAHPALATTKFTLLNRGTPDPCSRVYRLPTSNPSLRAKWLSLLDGPGKPGGNKQTPKPPTTEPNQRLLMKPLINSLNRHSEQPSHPPPPSDEDLIGFVTTGSFNLNAGKGTGIGAILVNKIEAYSPPTGSDIPECGQGERQLGKEKLTRTCIVRSPGESIGRLGWWEVI